MVAGIVPLERADPSVHALAGKQVRARGERRNGVFAAFGGVEAAREGAVAAATGTKSVAVLLFNFPSESAASIATVGALTAGSTAPCEDQSTEA